MDSQTVSRRDRVRAATVEEIKQTARRLMAESGSTDVRFSDIARAMGMTAPALYRYFADRDDLLTALISDGYADLADSLAAGARGSDPWRQFLGLARAFRQWGLDDPTRYALVFGMPIPDYEAPPEGNTSMDARRAMAALIGVLAAADEQGELDPPPVEVGAPSLNKNLTRVLPTVSEQRHQVALHLWMGLHGFVSLEIFGHLSMLPAKARDELFADHVRLVAFALGLREP